MYISSEDNYQADALINMVMTKQSTWLMEGSRAGDRHNDRVLTDKIIHDVRPTEGQCQEEIGEHQGSDYTPRVGTGH